tara:strand:+ start:33 stop:281 length:249 start_codon:yes stop_codon:yes gene_type:complete
MIGLTFKLVVDKADESILGWSTIKIISKDLFCAEIINTKTYYKYMLGTVCTNDDGSISYSEILHDDFYSEFIAGIYDLEAAP